MEQRVCPKCLSLLCEVCWFCACFCPCVRSPVRPGIDDAEED